MNRWRLSKLSCSCWAQNGSNQPLLFMDKATNWRIFCGDQIVGDSLLCAIQTGGMFLLTNLSIGAVNYCACATSLPILISPTGQKHVATLAKQLDRHLFQSHWYIHWCCPPCSSIIPWYGGSICHSSSIIIFSVHYPHRFFFVHYQYSSRLV